MNNCLVLLGVKHAGKTTTGQMLANRRNLPFFDIDNIIEQQTGKSCRDIYYQDGVDAFKNTEVDACRFFVEAVSTLMLNTKIKGVVAVGGGICDNPLALEILRTVGVFVYLDVPKHTAFERILETSKRAGSFPAYLTKETLQTEDDIEKEFYQLYEKRSALYRLIADISIDTTDLSPEKICDAVISAI